MTVAAGRHEMEEAHQKARHKKRILQQCPDRTAPQNDCKHFFPNENCGNLRERQEAGARQSGLQCESMSGNANSGRRGVELWVHQRVRRLAVMGLTPKAIARVVGIEAKAAKRLVRRALPKKWRRCTCGAMADAVPCVACQQLATGVNSVRPFPTR
jgi:hypothetical protein